MTAPNTASRPFQARQNSYRTVEKTIQSVKTQDGAGVRLQRSIGTSLLDMLDPFLMLDEFRSDNPNDYIQGFPDHPHRGFETVTYMLAGSMQHKDNQGNQGDLGPGSIQWMTAGRGIIHSEMPRQENGLMWGFQLWINLPAAEKMKDPRYQDIPAEQIPEVEFENGGSVRVIAGSFSGVEGVIQGISRQPVFLDVTLRPESAFEYPIPPDHNAFVYVFEGQAAVGETNAISISRGELGVLSAGNMVYIGTGNTSSRFLLLAARPIHEPVVKYGPFVMNTEAEIDRAIRDFSSGRFTK